MSKKPIYAFVALVFAVLALPHFAAAEGQLLWQIGKQDGSNTDFALAPEGYSRFKHDGFFIVGESNSKHDWPYVQPGPADAWAGGRKHVFTVIFGIKQPAPTGHCKLVFDLLDTHSDAPPKLRIGVNGSQFERQMPRGAGDASVEGQPGRGKRFDFVVEFPTSLLKTGNNIITIASVSGSWMLYDRVALETPDGIDLKAVSEQVVLQSLEAEPVLVEREGKRYQPINVSLLCVGENGEAVVRLGQKDLDHVQLNNGIQSTRILVPEVTKETEANFELFANGNILASQNLTQIPVRHMVIYVLMHSHNDVGYTDLQPNIAKKQAHNVARALELIRETKSNPVGSRFKWNLEVLLPAEDFFESATPQQKKEFEESVHDGDIGVDAMYANLLTGLCRSEELLRQFTFAKALGRRCGVNVDSMMISDVPGLTWGIVPALAQNGVRYISDGPNAGRGMEGDRIGYVRVTWENKPFYWASESGREKVLFWSAPGGYSFGHHFSTLKEALPVLFQRLAQEHYPYDIVQLRWTKGDNGPPDEGAISFIRGWNSTHAWPKLIIATTSEAFHAFEKRYGDELPTYRGDFTPYWDDGAGSGARETAMNRHSVDRLLQAETLWALLKPSPFPAADFDAAWKNAVLWDEHTWGAWNSVSDPDNPFVKKQWQFKKADALKADSDSRALLHRALAVRGKTLDNAADVFNTASWPRTDLVTLPRETQGDRVKDEAGQTVPSQRLSDGKLVFLARNIPPFGAKRYYIEAGTPLAGQARADGTTLSTPQLTVELDRTTGAIVSVRQAGLDVDLAGGEINTYLYLPGANVKDVESNGPVKITVKEAGPLVAELSVESSAPGCRKLIREVRLVDGLDRVQISDLVDKEAVRSIEGVHFGFEFNVPNPVVRVNSPGAVYQIEKDQLAGACKNWFAVERWVDIANSQYGITWSAADAPLVEVGGLTANLPRSQPDPNVYLKTIKPSSRIYSWVMNNHWETNYRADQKGPVWFRYALHPHHSYDPAAAMRFGIESTEPLIVAPASGKLPISPLTIQPSSVIATAYKPSDDGKAIILRLFNVAGKSEEAHLEWGTKPNSVFLSNASEQPLHPIGDTLDIAAWDLVTVRAELP